MNKKGMINQLLIGGMIFAIIVVVLGVVVYAFDFDFKKAAGKINPYDDTIEGCNPEYEFLNIHGDVLVEDSEWILNSIEPSPVEINILSSSRLALFYENFDYKVELYDRTAGRDVLTDTYYGNSEVIAFGSIVVPYDVQMKVLDANCNGQVDEQFDIKIKVTVTETSDIIVDTESIEQEFVYRNGEFI